MKGYHLANLALPPSFILVGDGNLTEEKREWTQPVRFWTLIYYEHRNVVTQQSESVLVQPGDMVLFAPCARGAHSKTGQDTFFQYLTFDLPGSTASFESLPRFLPGMDRVYDDLRRASARITDSALPSIAWVWGFCWSVAQPSSKYRGNNSLYQAEAYLRNNLDRRVSVVELAAQTGISSRQLLRLFRDEHNLTVQDYSRQLRIQEASRLLLNTELAIKAIAARVGYSDLQEFNKLIRSGTGASPSAFREASRNRN